MLLIAAFLFNAVAPTIASAAPAEAQNSVTKTNTIASNQASEPEDQNMYLQLANFPQIQRSAATPDEAPTNVPCRNKLEFSIAVIISTPIKLPGKGSTLQFQLAAYKTANLATDPTGALRAQAVSITSEHSGLFAQRALLEIKLDRCLDFKNLSRVKGSEQWSVFGKWG